MNGRDGWRRGSGGGGVGGSSSFSYVGVSDDVGSSGPRQDPSGMERTYAAPSGSGVPTTQWRPSRRIAGPQRDRATGHATPERGRPGAPPLRDVRQPDDRDRDTVGTLLAAIANSINDGLTLMRFADKRQWGPDEFEQVRALERCLDSAKRDFQELSALLNGQTYYTGDTTRESLDELRALRIKFDAHAKNFKDWSRSGGPINAIWARETDELGRELHRAQRRAARRVFEAEREAEARCLGAFQVYRKRRRAGELLAQRQQRQNRTPSPSSSQQGERRYGDGPTPMAETEEEDPLQLELMACAEVGRFERLGDRDIGFVCDFCDGYIVWEDLQSVPTARTICTAAGAAAARDHQHLRNTSASSVATTVRSSLGSSYFSKRPSSALASILPTITSMPSPIPITPGGPGPGVGGRTPLPTRQTSVTPPPASSPAAVVDPSAVTDIGNYAEHWEATGVSATSGEERTVVFAPLVVASHMPPRPAGVGGMGLDRGFGRDSRDGDDAQFDGTRWKARLLCHYCDALTYENPGDGEVEISKYVQDDGGFPDLNALQRHLERYHTSLAAGVVEAGRTATCVVM